MNLVLKEKIAKLKTLLVDQGALLSKLTDEIEQCQQKMFQGAIPSKLPENSSEGLGYRLDEDDEHVPDPDRTPDIDNPFGAHESEPRIIATPDYDPITKDEDSPSIILSTPERDEFRLPLISPSPALPDPHVFRGPALPLIEGYFLFSFTVESHAELEIGYSQDQSSYDYLTLSGGGMVSGRPVTISGFSDVRLGDVLTICITKGTGQLQLVHARTGDCMQAPFPQELPVLGPVYPVIKERAGLHSRLNPESTMALLESRFISPLPQPLALPELGWILRDEFLMTDGPLPTVDIEGPGNICSLLFQVESETSNALFAFTTAFGASKWLGRRTVLPLWLFDFEAAEISYKPPRPTDGRASQSSSSSNGSSDGLSSTWEARTLRQGDIVGVRIAGKAGPTCVQLWEIKLFLNQKEIGSALNLGRVPEATDGLFLVTEGVDLKILGKP